MNWYPLREKKNPALLGGARDSFVLWRISDRPGGFGGNRGAVQLALLRASHIANLQDVTAITFWRNCSPSSQRGGSRSFRGGLYFRPANVLQRLFA